MSWELLEEMLHSRDFSQKWICWINNIVRDGSLCIKINDEDSKYFRTKRGLRQGDPLSPLLFNLVTDVFTRMVMKVADQSLISGQLSNVLE